MTDLFRTKPWPVQRRYSTGVLTSVLSVLLLAPTACADGDAKSGAEIFKKKCGACHAVGPDAKNRVGPILNGIIGRKAGTVEGFKYSKANAKAGEEGWVWSEEVMLDYLANPRKAMPGNKMGFGGLTKADERADVVAYLKTLGGSGADAGSASQGETKAAQGNTEKATKSAQTAPPPTKKEEADAKAEEATAAKGDTGTQKAASAERGAETASAGADAAGQQGTDGEAAASIDGIIVGGAAPSARPATAPRVETVEKDGVWYQRALTGIEPPYAASYRFLEDQGNWHTPFNHPGMTGPYDIRGWHQPGQGGTAPTEQPSQAQQQ